MAQSMPARRDQQPIILPAMPFKVVEPGMLSTNQLDASAVSGENEPVNRSEARSLLDSVLDLHAQGESPLASQTENILRIDAADPRHAGVVPAVKRHWHDAKRPDVVRAAALRRGQKRSGDSGIQQCRRSTIMHEHEEQRAEAPVENQRGKARAVRHDGRYRDAHCPRVEGSSEGRAAVDGGTEQEAAMRSVRRTRGSRCHGAI